MTDGTLTFNNTLVLAGTRSIEVTATDSGGVSVTQSVPIVIALAHNFGDDFGKISFEEIFDTQGDDTIRFWSGTAQSGEVRLSLGGGSVRIEFGNGAAFQGKIFIDDISGTDGGNISARDHAVFDAVGDIEVRLSAGDDTVSFGNSAADDGAIELILGSSENRVTFGDFAAAQVSSAAGGEIDIDGGSGADHVTFGANVTSGLGKIYVFTDDGDDTLKVGNNAGQNGGMLFVNGGTGADQITIGAGLENAQVLLRTRGLPGHVDADQLTFEGTL